MINLEPSLLCLRGDVTSNWITFNPILKLNEPAIEIFNDGNVKMKIGNGVNNFLDLPYLNEADKTTSIVAGSGLTGGGNLTEDRTIDINPADDSLTVTADNVKVNTNNTLTSTSTTQPLSANQGKVLNEKVVQVENDLNQLNSDIDELVTLKEDKASKQIISDVRYAALVESGEILPDVLYYTYEE